ncbi:hypothetical protein NHJ13051_008765 [Beauveria bassiana]
MPTPMTTDPALEIMENNPVPDWNAPPNAALTPSSSYLSMLGGGLPDLGVDSADLFLTHCPTPLDSGVPDGMEDAIMGYDVDLACPSTSSSTASPSYSSSKDFPDSAACTCVRILTSQLGDVLERVAVRSMIGTLDKVMRKFEVKIDFLSSEKAHIEFLKSEVKRIKRGFALIIAQSSTVED